MDGLAFAVLASREHSCELSLLREVSLLSVSWVTMVLGTWAVPCQLADILVLLMTVLWGELHLLSVFFHSNVDRRPHVCESFQDACALLNSDISPYVYSSLWRVFRLHHLVLAILTAIYR